MADRPASGPNELQFIGAKWVAIPPEIKELLLSNLSASFRNRHHGVQRQARNKTNCIKLLLAFAHFQAPDNNNKLSRPYKSMAHKALSEQHPDFALFLGLSQRDTTLIDRALSGGANPGSRQFCRFSTAWPGYNCRDNTIINALAAAMRFHCFGHAHLFVTTMARDYQELLALRTGNASDEDSSSATSEEPDDIDDNLGSDRLPPTEAVPDSDGDSHINADDNDDSGFDYPPDFHSGHTLEAFGWCTWGVYTDGRPKVSFDTHNRSRSALFEFIRAVQIGPVAVCGFESVDTDKSLQDGRALLDALLPTNDTDLHHTSPLFSDISHIMMCAGQPTVPAEYFNIIVRRLGHYFIHYDHLLERNDRWGLCFMLIYDGILQGAVVKAASRDPELSYIPPSSQADVLSKIRSILQVCHDHDYFNRFPCSNHRELAAFVNDVAFWVWKLEDVCFGERVYELCFRGHLAWPGTEHLAERYITSRTQGWNVLQGTRFYAERLVRRA